MSCAHSRRRSNVFWEARFWFCSKSNQICPNLNHFAPKFRQNLLKFCPNFKFWTFFSPVYRASNQSRVRAYILGFGPGSGLKSRSVYNLVPFSLCDCVPLLRLVGDNTDWLVSKVAAWCICPYLHPCYTTGFRPCKSFGTTSDA